jgi:L-2-hydroxyglutarate oxidase LhgO
VARTACGEIAYGHFLNAAGLYADRIAREFGFSRHYTILPFKGIYLKDSSNRSGLTTNIYPVPNLANPFLGVHFTLTVDGAAKIGPTAIPAFWRENYRGLERFSLRELGAVLGWEARLFLSDAFGFRSLALEEMKKYRRSHLLELAERLAPRLETRHYDQWSTPGIRAQLLDTRSLELVQDFVVEGDGESTHVLNAVSPAFTASIPFARWVVGRVPET